MSRAKLFVENFFVYGFVQTINKIVPFLLLPVITRMLNDPSEYGIYDMFIQIIGIGSPIIIMGVYDAMFREYFEKDDLEYKHDVTTTAQRLILSSSILWCSLLIIFNNSISTLLYGNNTYGRLVIFAAFSLIFSTNNAIISAPTRMKNKRKIYFVSGLISSIGGYTISILLVWLGYSYWGLVYSDIVIGCILLSFFFILNHRDFLKGKFDKRIAKELLNMGLPLIPVFIIYWIYNSMDRIMISNMLGTTELGIYSIGSRVAHISMLIYSAFAGGWQYFAFSTMNDHDQVDLTSNVFEYLAAISFASLFCLYPFIQIMFKILFPAEYFGGYVVVPYLYLAPLLLMLFQVAGNQFLVKKKTYLSTITLALGAVSNVVLNMLLIPLLGSEGAAIATLIGYVISISVVCLITIKMDLLKISLRFCLISLIITVYLVTVRLFFYNNMVLQLILSVTALLLFILLYRKEISMLTKKIITRRVL